MTGIAVYDPRTGELIMEKPTYEQLEKDRDEWKALWFAEVSRGDHEFEETYTIRELDRAHERLAGWHKKTDKAGNITAEFDS